METKEKETEIKNLFKAANIMVESEEGKSLYKYFISLEVTNKSLKQENERLLKLIDQAWTAGARKMMKPFSPHLSGEYCPDLQTWKKENNI